MSAGRRLHGVFKLFTDARCNTRAGRWQVVSRHGTGPLPTHQGGEGEVPMGNYELWGYRNLNETVYHTFSDCPEGRKIPRTERHDIPDTRRPILRGVKDSALGPAMP